jgi:hypothetical protein
MNPREDASSKASMLTLSLFLLLEIFFFTFVLRPIENLDFWWHLATGRLIHQTHHIPLVDTFSFTCKGNPWINNYWLFEIILYEFYRFANLWGILILKGLLASLIFLPLLLRLRMRRLGPTAIVFTSVLAFYGCRLSSSGWDEHASQITLLFLSWLFWHLDMLDDEKIAASSLWIWAPIFALWTNTHPGWPFGLAVISLWALCKMTTDSFHTLIPALIAMA